MTALARFADSSRSFREVREVTTAIARLLNHLVGGHEQIVRHGEPKRLSGR